MVNDPPCNFQYALVKNLEPDGILPLSPSILSQSAGCQIVFALCAVFLPPQTNRVSVPALKQKGTKKERDFRYFPTLKVVRDLGLVV